MKAAGMDIAAAEVVVVVVVEEEVLVVVLTGGGCENDDMNKESGRGMSTTAHTHQHTHSFEPRQLVCFIPDHQ